MRKEKNRRLQNIERNIFFPTLILVAASVLIMLFMPEKAGQVINRAFDVMIHKVGWLYLAVVPIVFGLTLWIAFSKFGKIKLGEPGDKKQYSDWAWTAMMFTAGMSAATVVLSFTDPITLMTNPPLGAEPMSLEAYGAAHMYNQFACGPIAWGLYGPASAAVAYMIFVKKVSVLRISSTCTPVLRDGKRKWIGTLIDILMMLGMIGGVSTSLGIGTPTVSAFINHLTGIPESTTLTICIMAIWGLMFGTSVYLGLEKGIKNLSDFNFCLLFILLVFVMIKSPMDNTLYLELNSIGLVVDNIGTLLFGSTPFNQDTFTQNYTVFYWAWWLSFMPMIALFGARISKGRTIKQMLLGEVLYGGGGSMLVFGVCGGYSLYLQQSGTMDLVSIIADQGSAYAVLSVIGTLPFPKIFMWLTLALLFIFLATTIDSTAYTLASVCTVRLTGDEQPARWNRLLWAVLLLLFSLSLVLIGGLQTIQTASILTGFPMIFIVGIIVAALVQMKRESKTHGF